MTAATDAEFSPETYRQRFAKCWDQLRHANIWHDERVVPLRVRRFRETAVKLLLIEQWVLLVPVAITAYCMGNSWLGLLVIGVVFHGVTTLSRRGDPIGLTTRALIATGLLLDVLLLIYALNGTGSWQMDGGHMWIFAVWSHALGLLCWRSLLFSGALGVFHHFLLVILLPLWVFPDAANMWRVLLHAGVVVMQLSALCAFVVLIKRMLIQAETLEAAMAENLESVSEISLSKSRFLAHMSHELRTPLNAIIGFSDVMRAQLFGELSPRYVDYAQNIHASGSHLHDLIDDILDMSRVESGKHKLCEDVLKADTIIEHCVTMVSAKALVAQIEILTSIPADLPHLRADERALKQVLLNLLTNAIKFTPAGGSVMIALALNSTGLTFTVTDTGIGISQTALTKVFEPFQRGESLVARKTEGTGLGLAISRTLIELHEGTLTLFSALGKGTSAVIFLPAHRLIENGVR